MATAAPITGAPTSARPFSKQSPPLLFELVAQTLTALEFADALAEAIQCQAADADENAISISVNAAAITAQAHLDHVRAYQRLSDSLLSCLRTQVALAREAAQQIEEVAP